MLKRQVGIVLALPIVLGGVGAAQAAPSACDAVSGNLVANCGFETTGGWSPLDMIPAPHTGARSMLLGLTSPPASEQTITTVGGQSYSLGFWGSNVGFSSIPFSFAVFFDGTKVGDYTPGAFAEYTASVTASSTSSILRFERTGSFGYGYIDDVVLLATQAPSTDVPEPASLAVLGAGLAGLAGLARRRRRKA